MPSPEPRDLLLGWFNAALESVDGRRCVRRALADQSFAGSVALIAIGKAAVAMAQGANDALGDKIKCGFVVTKHGYDGPLPWPVLTAGHPVPDQSSLDAGEALLEYINSLPARADVLFLLSGGASSLIEVLEPGLTLPHLQQLNKWVLGAGIDIVAANNVRKRFSMIKAGRLAQHLAPHSTICLTISDVPGNSLSTIGSGLLVQSNEFELPDNLPEWVVELIGRTKKAAVESGFDHVQTDVIATIEDARQAVMLAAQTDGFDVNLHEPLLLGDVLSVGPQLATTVSKSASGQVHVWGGETTVQLPAQPGRGGRSQSLALAAAIAFDGSAGQYLLAMGTDGSDGPGEDAGALVDGNTVSRGKASGFDAHKELAAANAGAFLEASGDLVATGPTGTNVMDLVIGLTV